MTLPFLVANYQKHVAVEQFKKAYSTLANAEKMAVADFGDSLYWDYTNVDTFVNTYYVPYLNILTNKTNNNDYDVKNLNGKVVATWKKWPNHSSSKDLYLADGMVIKYWGNNQYYVFTVDVNGPKNPNTFGKDIWDFEFLVHKKLTPKGMGYNWTDDFMSNGCKTYTPVSGFGCVCSGLLLRNGYKIDKKYPW